MKTNIESCFINKPWDDLSPEQRKMNYEYMQQAISTLEENIHHYDENCKSAYAQLRLERDKHQAFKNKARALLHFARQAISTCNTSIILAGGLDNED